ncbi:MAG: hypothetical protein GWO20_18015 [Candidatus Korarchaeota archaeon]|nr:hypothetical protein [Candidatus Korarchaeota archaeon]
MTEHLGGISYTETTNLQGLASINCTFGKYSVEVYKDSVFLNETLTDLFNDTDLEVYCKFYNLTISVKIVDYFGQQIPAVNVTIQRDGLQYLPSTKSDGSIKFLDIIGGNLKLEVYLDVNVQPSVVKSFYIDKPSLIHIKISKYVLIAGLLVETGQLATLSIIILATLLVISLEVYRRRHPKLQKS